MGRTISTGRETRLRLVEGALTLCKALAVTYGPKGRTVMLDRPSGLITTKDGVTVAREIVLEDPIQNQGAQILKESCSSVCETVGDGTTTTAILAASLLQETQKFILAGLDLHEIQEGVRHAQNLAFEALRRISKEIKTQKDLKQVALSASNHDQEIAEKLTSACMAVGKDGTISIEDSPGVKCFLEFKEGMEINSGAASLGFLEDAAERTIEGCLVAVVDDEIRDFDEIREILEVASQWPQNELVVFARRFSNEVLTTMVVNNHEKVVRCCAISAPGYRQAGEHLKDISALADAHLCDPAGGDSLLRWDAEWFGSFRKATIKKDSALLQAYDTSTEAIQNRVSILRAEKKQSSSTYDKDRLTERLAKLSGGIAILKVGEATEAAMKERRGRVEDTLHALRAALKKGVVPGTGSAYMAASVFAEANRPKSVVSSEFLTGYDAAVRSLQSPMSVLVRNAGKEGNVLVHSLRRAMNHKSGDSLWIGYDVLQDCFRSVRDLPDPTSVAEAAVRAAFSVVSVLLTCEISISRGPHAK